MTDLAGFVGVGFYLGAYAALQLGYLRGRGYAYPLLNFIAAGLVLTSLWYGDWNQWSAIIQISFMTISVVGISRIYLLNRTIHIGTDERKMLTAIVPGLDKVDAQRIVRLGRWVDARDRLVLTQEGLPISDLIWVSSGRVGIHVGDQRVASMGAGAVLGEATCLTGAPATATIMVEGEARYFAIPVAKLRALAERNPLIMSKLQESFSRHMRDKLHETNKRAAEQARRA